MEKLEFYDAVKCFDEVELGYTEYEATREAQRCLGCTTGATVVREKCSACLTCVRVCPHGAPGVKVGGFLYFDAEACHACGACASQCPAQAISLVGHTEEDMDRKVERALVGARPGHHAALRMQLDAQHPHALRRRRARTHRAVSAARERAHGHAGASNGRVACRVHRLRRSRPAATRTRASSSTSGPPRSTPCSRSSAWATRSSCPRSSPPRNWTT